MKLIGITDFKDNIFVQAYLVLKLFGYKIEEVSYIRTLEKDVMPEIIEFWALEGIKPSIKSLYNKGIFETEEDFVKQELQIMQWYYYEYLSDNQLLVFVGGGHKLHSSILQRCCTIFGAYEIFHMFSKASRGNEPKNIMEIEEALEKNEILLTRLGFEPGWMVFKNYDLSRSDIRNTVYQIIENIKNRNIAEINEYPFESLSYLPSSTIEWLKLPLEGDDYEFIKELPKVDLHCHLGGFATQDNLLDMVRNAADESFILPITKNIEYPLNWPLPENTIDLLDYMKLGDNNGSYILKNKGCLEKQIDLLYSHFIDQKIGYAEVRCSPYNYESDVFNGYEILKIIQDRFDKNMENADQNLSFWCHVNLIIIATRTKEKNHKKIEDHLQLATLAESSSRIHKRCKIVGVDLAGFEDKSTRANLYKRQFLPIHQKGIALTIHAGENDDAEGIWMAVFELNARRLGHALHLYQDKYLLKSIIHRKIGIEMCPFANYQIKGFYPMKNKSEYPILQYLRAGAQVTINTDNIGISNASITDNILLLAKTNKGITRLEILQLIRNGLEQAFIDYELKKILIKIFNEKIFMILTKKNMHAPHLLNHPSTN